MLLERMREQDRGTFWGGVGEGVYEMAVLQVCGCSGQALARVRHPLLCVPGGLGRKFEEACSGVEEVPNAN